MVSYIPGQLALIVRVFEILLPVTMLNVMIFNFLWCGRFGFEGKTV